MIKKQDSQKGAQLPFWKRMTLVTAVFLLGSSLATFIPGQAYASTSKQNRYHHTGPKGQSTRRESTKLLIICQTGNGGKGGSANKKSNGAYGGSGGNCNITIPITIYLNK